MSIECYCSDEDYKIIELDYSNSNCDYSELGGQGGSDYYLKSVYKVDHFGETKIFNRFYLNHSGCFNIQSNFSDIFIEFKKNNSAFNCAKFCQLMNISTFISRKSRCFCIRDSFQDYKISITSCGLESLIDGHYIGNNQTEDQYIINCMFFKKNIKV